jgi:hypothetical protein
MMLKYLSAFLILIIVSSCNSRSSGSLPENKVAENTPLDNSKTSNSNSDQFRTAFETFFNALHQSDTATINRFIHPENGLWIIEQPGAVPKMTRVKSIQNFKREFQERSFFTIASDINTCNLTEAPHPKFDCGEMNYEEGKTGYSQDGCFVWDAEKFKQSGYWNYASLAAPQIQQIQNTLPLLSKSVLHTPSSFEFHFGIINKQWYLLFAKIIYPCSA